MALTRMLVIALFFIVVALSSTTTNPATSIVSSAGLAFAAIAPSSSSRRMPSSSSSRVKMKQPVKRRVNPSSRTQHTTRKSDKKTIENSLSDGNGADIGSSGSGDGKEGEASPSVVKEGEGGGNNMDNVDATGASDRNKNKNNAFEPQPHWKRGFDKNKERRGRFPPSKQPSAKGKAWRKPSDLTIDPNMKEDESHETVNRATQGGKAVPTLPSQRSKKGIWRSITSFVGDLFLFNKGKKNYIIVLTSRIILFIISLYVVVRIYKNRLKIMKKVGLGRKDDDYYLSR